MNRKKEKEDIMNKVILMGRLTRDPEIRYSQGENATAVARYTLAVERRIRNEEQSADFIRCVAFGKLAEFAEKWLKQGTKICISGRIQTGLEESCMRSCGFNAGCKFLHPIYTIRLMKRK